MKLRLGLIGKSAGNGHPYSWAAICNGYSPKDMKDCGYASIPKYLAMQKWPHSQLKNATITHLWTQDHKLSRKIADATHIGEIVNHPTEMIGNIDALLLARDDANNHFGFAKPFLEIGLPIYIDKPIATNLDDYYKLISLQRYSGQIFSCSALRFSPEMKLSKSMLKKLGPIRLIQGLTPKYWETYAVHLIDPLLLILGLDSSPKKLYSTALNGKGRTLGFRTNNNGPNVQLTAAGADISAPISLRIIGEYDEITLTFENSFLAFRNTLERFISIAMKKEEILPERFNLEVVRLIEMGLI